MPTDNPYAPPQTLPVTSARSVSVVAKLRRCLPWFIAAVLGLCCLYFLYCNRVLRDQYPNLEDHTPGRDWYWPQIAHLVNNVFAGVLAVIAAVIVAATVIWRITRNRQASTMVTEREHVGGNLAEPTIHDPGEK